MITTGIKEAKNNLSGFLALVKAGEEILITDRENRSPGSSGKTGGGET